MDFAATRSSGLASCSGKTTLSPYPAGGPKGVIFTWSTATGLPYVC